MRKLSDLRGEKALDILADILEPAGEIMSDKDVILLARAGENLRAVSVAIKNHKRAVIKVLAALDEEDPKTYEPSIMAIPLKLLEVFNDPDVIQVFTYQGQKTEDESSGSVTESIMETEKE